MVVHMKEKEKRNRKYCMDPYGRLVESSNLMGHEIKGPTVYQILSVYLFFLGIDWTVVDSHIEEKIRTALIIQSIECRPVYDFLLLAQAPWPRVNKKKS